MDSGTHDFESFELPEQAVQALEKLSFRDILVDLVMLIDFDRPVDQPVPFAP